MTSKPAETQAAEAYLASQKAREAAQRAWRQAVIARDAAEANAERGRQMYMSGTRAMVEAMELIESLDAPGVLYATVADIKAKAAELRRKGRGLRREGEAVQKDARAARRTAAKQIAEAQAVLSASRANVKRTRGDLGMSSLLDWEK